MTEEVTPTTDDIEFAYIDRRGFTAFLSGDTDVTDEVSSAEFKRWLDEHDRALSEKRWDEGHAACNRDWEFTADLSTPDEDRQPLKNPYRVGNNDD